MLKTLLWTLCSVGVGVFLASYPVDGRTPLQHLERAWKHSGKDGLEELKSRVGDGLEDAKDRFTHTKVTPHEHHNAEDREALDKLIARRTTNTRS